MELANDDTPTTLANHAAAPHEACIVGGFNKYEPEVDGGGVALHHRRKAEDIP